MSNKFHEAIWYAAYILSSLNLLLGLVEIFATANTFIVTIVKVEIILTGIIQLECFIFGGARVSPCSLHFSGLIVVCFLAVPFLYVNGSRLLFFTTIFAMF